MKKFKKIFMAAIAGAIAISTASAVSATGVAADDFKFEQGPNAEFGYKFGYADMINLSNASRYGSARVEIKNRKTNASVEARTQAGMLGLYDCVVVSFVNYSEITFMSECSGSIHSHGAEQSPVDWYIEKTV